jgi:RimJ/RimL family protein N-acetyltransferase
MPAQPNDSVNHRAAIRLIVATAGHFDWAMRGSGSGLFQGELRLPLGGLDSVNVLAWIKRTSQAVSDATDRPAAWLIANGDEVVGLISFKSAPRDGAIEIGYGVAESRRDRGYATQAVALVIEHAAADKLDLVAETAAENRASQIVLERNGFRRCGERSDPDEGALLLWRLYCKKSPPGGGDFRLQG